MKLPNDLIKATDYDKAKDRIIHEFEYVNGKFIQHYALGGEHELSTQEIVDCLNALLTIDCDLRTAYACIQGQKEKIANLEAKLAESENKNFELIAKLNLKEHRPAFCTLADRECEALGKVEQLKQQLAEKTLTIEQINKAFIENRSLWKGKYERANQDKISFAVEQLERLKKLCQEKFNWWENSEWEGDIYDKSDVSNAYFDIEANIDKQIEELKKDMKQYETKRI